MCAWKARIALAGLLVVLVLAKLAGMQSLVGAADWVRDQEAFLREGLQLPWKRMPCANTYSYALARLDRKAGQCRAGGLVCAQGGEIRRCGEEPSRLVTQSSGRAVHLAVDGKALRGTGKQAYGGEEPQQQVLHVYEVHTGIVVQQCPIAAQHNEVSTLKPLLTQVLCKGRILTSDAAQSYHDGWRLVTRAGGDAILFIKDNTPATRADLELFFEDKQADRGTWQVDEQMEKGHGRLERRHITTSPDRGALFASGLGRGRTGLSRRTRTQMSRQAEPRGGLWFVDSPTTGLSCWAHGAVHSWALGSGKSAELPPGCHGWREDRCGVRFPPVAQMLAVLNSVVLSLMDLHHVPSARSPTPALRFSPSRGACLGVLTLSATFEKP